MESATQPVTDVKTDAAPEMISAGQIVAKMLKQEGIQHIFTISGGHIVDIYNGCIDEGIEIVDVRHEQVPGSRPYRSRCGVRAFGWYAATPCRRTLWSAPATGHELAGAGEPPSVHFSNLPAGKTNQCPSAQSTRTCSMGPSVDSSTNRSAMATNAVQSSSGHIVNAKRPFLKFARLASLTCRGILFASRFRACRPLTSISVLLLAE